MYLSKPARRVKLLVPPTAQQMGRMGLEWLMLIFLSTWLLELPDVVLILWPLQHTAIRTIPQTGIRTSSAYIKCGVCVCVCACMRVRVCVRVQQ